MDSPKSELIRARVVGTSPLAADVRTALLSSGALLIEGGHGPDTIDAMVFAPWDRSAMTAVPFDELSDDQFDQAWQHTMDEAIAACSEARTSFGPSGGAIVLTTFTTGFAGGAGYAHWAAAAEGVHILAKSLARQWGPEGISVNALALSPDEVGVDTTISGPISIALPARPGASWSSTLAFLCSSSARDLAGQTLTVDGGLWM